MIKLLNSYTNGNTIVSIYENGTKVRETLDDEFVAEFPENIDIKITNKCSGVNGIICPWCHEASTPSGLNAELTAPFINTLHPGTELAVGGGNVFEHPGLMKFLFGLYTRKIISNITINQAHYIEKLNVLEGLSHEKAIHGIGVSATGGEIPLLNDNVVLHVINGIHSIDEILALAKQGHKKLLILGYKNIRRGADYLEKNFDAITKNSLYDHLHKIVRAFEVVSFDNLALEQLAVRRLFATKQWEEFYMGDDGQFTMYIDLVKQEFARNSTSMIRYPLLDNIVDMFKVVKAEKV